MMFTALKPERYNYTGTLIRVRLFPTSISTLLKKIYGERI
jgi:hypothetical protein